MAAGLQASQGSAGRRRNWRLLDAAIATNSPPSGASAGRALSDLPVADFGTYYESKSVGVLVYSTAGSATMTVTIDIWGYDSIAGAWFNLGRLNAGSAIAETGTDVIRYAEVMDDLFDWDRLYAEVVAIGGTSTAITVDLRVPLHSRP
jgi:hypothetical protein